MVDINLGGVISAAQAAGDELEAAVRAETAAQITALTGERDIAQAAANSAETKLADANRLLEEARAGGVRDGQRIVELEDLAAGLQRELTAARARIAELEAGNPDPDPDPDPPSPTKTALGYHCLWSDLNVRLAIVGTNNIHLYRVFADRMTTDGRREESKLREVIRRGWKPLVSYKTKNDSGAKVSANDIVAGAFDARARATAAFLASLDVEVDVAIDHEPWDDMSGADFVRTQERLIPIFAAHENIRCLPIIQGFPLDTATNRARFRTYQSDRLFGEGGYGLGGIDTYQPGSATNPGNVNPGSRIAPLLAMYDDMGFPDLHIAVGEWNAFTDAFFQSTMDTFAATERLEYACAFDKDLEVASLFTGRRLEIFKAMKASGKFL